MLIRVKTTINESIEQLIEIFSQLQQVHIAKLNPVIEHLHNIIRHRIEHHLTTHVAIATRTLLHRQTVSVNVEPIVALDARPCVKNKAVEIGQNILNGIVHRATELQVIKVVLDRGE